MDETLALPTYATLLLGFDGPVATVTLNRPERLNALNAATFDDLERVFTLLERDPTIRVVLLAGAGGKAFAAGADIPGLKGLDAAGAEKVSARGQAVLNGIERCGKLVIACVHGFALGGGLELALACHMRFAGEGARFGMPEAKLGLIPGYGGTARLPRLVGEAAALKLLLANEPIDAATALRIGLVEEVVPDALSRGRELAGTIATLAPRAVATLLELLPAGRGKTQAEAQQLETAAFARLFSTRDAAEGIAAFLEKRAPDWAGA